MTDKVYKRACTDHLETVYRSKQAMCRAWNVPIGTYKNRDEERRRLRDMMPWL